MSTGRSSFDTLAQDVESMKQQMMNKRPLPSLRKVHSTQESLYNTRIHPAYPSRSTSVPASFETSSSASTAYTLIDPPYTSPLFNTPISTWSSTYVSPRREPNQPHLSLISLPSEILSRITIKLLTRDLHSLGCVSKHFHHFVKQNHPSIPLSLVTCLFCRNRTDEFQRLLCTNCQSFEARASTIGRLNSSACSNDNMQILLSTLMTDSDSTIRSMCLTALASKYLSCETARVAIQQISTQDKDPLCRSQAANCLLYLKESSKPLPPSPASPEKTTYGRLSVSARASPTKRTKASQDNKENRENCGSPRKSRSASMSKVTVHKTATDCIVMRIDTPQQERIRERDRKS